MEPQDQDQDQTRKTAADRAFEEAKETVGKGVASTAGAVHGFNEKMDEKDLSGKAKEAIQKTGQTTREIAGTAAKEAVKTKEHVQDKAVEGKDA
ncbi:MAG: hypothetical protein QOE90_2284 [Thermoplasmata archaeon]|jgi:hypothetical protein|nr:hypothetical protein [Thermoplasmata archaeon]